MVVRHLYEVMEINVRDCWDFFFLFWVMMVVVAATLCESRRHKTDRLFY